MSASTISALFEPLSGRMRAEQPVKDGDAPGKGTMLAALFASLTPLQFGEVGAAFGVGGRFDRRT